MANTSQSLAVPVRGLPDSAGNRRVHRRLSPRAFQKLRTARIKYGSDVRIVDISAGGMAVETRDPLKPNTRLVFELSGEESSILIPSQVVRSQFVGLYDAAMFRAGCQFKTPLDLSRLVDSVQGPDSAGSVGLHVLL